MAGYVLCSTSVSLFLLVYLSSSAAAAAAVPGHSPTPPLHIRQACEATRFPQECLSSLSQSHNLPPNPTSLQIIQSAIAISSHNIRTAEQKIHSILDNSFPSTPANRTNAARSCLDVLHYSDYRLSLVYDALRRGKDKDARAWMSAAYAYQYDCWSGLKYVYGNDTVAINDTLTFLFSMAGHSSNALSMMVSYDVFGKDTASWKVPRTEREGFWEVPSIGEGEKEGLTFGGGVPLNLGVDVTVSKGGGKGCYKTVQEAVNAAPDNGEGRFVIHIRAGVYEETVRIPLEKTNVVLLGDGMGKTVITAAAHVGQPGMTTYNSATVGVYGDGFMAKNLTIENAAGPAAGQAVAFRTDSDHSVLESCEFLGHQDTIYAHSLRQFYKSCRIQGNVDFIFGNSASVFQDCHILVTPKQSNPLIGENNAITAHGRTDPAQSTGFVFMNCVINGTPEYMAQYRQKPEVHKNYLGRPWKEYSRTVFINNELEVLIAPEGWMAWNGDLGLKTLYYGEYGNTGAGSNLNKRVAWSSRIPQGHVLAYSVQNFIQGDNWIPMESHSSNHHHHHHHPSKKRHRTARRT